MTMSNYHTIGLANDISDIDAHVLLQAIQHHFPTVTIADNNYDLIIDNALIGVTPNRIGHVLDVIEKHLFNNRVFDTIDYGRYSLDWEQSCLSIGNHTYDLSERERDLLTELILAGDAGCHKDYLLNKIWGFKVDLETHALETQIYRLRQKIETNPENPEFLITTSKGYKLA